MVYLNRDLDTARLQIAKMLEHRSVQPDDLTDDAYELAAARLPGEQAACDVVGADGIAAAGLPRSYPDDGHGRRVSHAVCQPIGHVAHVAGLDGVAAATLDGVGRELAWWPRDRPLAPFRRRVPYGDWRSAQVADVDELFVANA